MKKILFIDDHEDTAELMAKIVADRGFETDYETRPIRGLEKALQTHPDMVVLDVMMPEMSGLEVALRLKDEGIHAIFLTAYKQKQEDIDRTGVMDCLEKPVKIDDLILKIEGYLGMAA